MPKCKGEVKKEELLFVAGIQCNFPSKQDKPEDQEMETLSDCKGKVTDIRKA